MRQFRYPYLIEFNVPVKSCKSPKQLSQEKETINMKLISKDSKYCHATQQKVTGTLFHGLILQIMRIIFVEMSY
jgi:hypothetical protein